MVELIRSGGKSLSLVILTLPPSEVTKLEPLEDVMNPDYFDYSDKNQINITIPETRQIENGREKYAVRYWFECVCVHVKFCVIYFQMYFTCL